MVEEYIDNNIKIDDDFILDILYLVKNNKNNILTEHHLTRCFENSNEKRDLHTLRSLINRKDIDTILIRKYKKE